MITTPRELTACSLPLLAEGDDEQYPYWFGGTCFLCRYGEKLYAVTAKHCLRDKAKDQVRIQRRPNSPTFITLSGLFTQNPSSLHREDPDQDDWAVLEALDPAEQHDDDLVQPLDLDVVPDAALPPTDQHRFLVRGYPKKICRIEYDACAIKWQAFLGSATYRERPSWSRFCHTVVIDDVSGVESIDGLSGSPLFLVETRPRPHVFAFAGLALRGSKESSLLHFLEARVVRAAVVAAHTLAASAGTT